MAQSKASSAHEWRQHWPLLLAATLGISFGGIPTITLGLFMQPLQSEFGWSRTTVSLGMTVFAFLVTPLTPFAGALVDRFGSRAVAIPGLVLCGLFFSAFSLMNGMVALWIGMWVVYSLASLLIRTMVWNPPVSMAFVSNRGIAIAILLSGMSIASAVSPLLTHTLIQNFGWRGAYIGIGLGWTAVALALVIPFFRVKAAPQAVSAAQAAPVSKVLPGGLTGKEALRNLAIIRIAAAGLVAMTLGSAYSVHMVPIYVSLGLERGEAASMAIVVGIAGVASKLVVGSIADRVNSGILPLVSFALPALGYGLLLIASGSTALMVTAAAIIGIGSGATLHMVMYLTTQYGGLRNFGKIYGSVSALFGIAAGVGPVTAGLIFDAYGNYDLYLMIGIPMFVAAGLLVFGLGPYPEFKAVELPEEDPARPMPAATR